MQTEPEKEQEREFEWTNEQELFGKIQGKPVKVSFAIPIKFNAPKE